jgi:hypothetical protein
MHIVDHLASFPKWVISREICLYILSQRLYGSRAHDSTTLYQLSQRSLILPEKRAEPIVCLITIGVPHCCWKFVVIPYHPT